MPPKKKLDSAAPQKTGWISAIVGTDSLLRRQALDALMAGFGPNCDAATAARFDGAEVSLAELLDDVRTLSLWGGARIVIVTDGDSLVTRFREKLESACESAAAPAGKLILLCDSLPKNWRIRKSIESVGVVVELAQSASPEWTLTRARNEYEKTISRDTANVLLDAVGNAPARVDVELAKLASYVGDRSTIERADVEKLSPNTSIRDVFKLYNAVASRSAKNALEIWGQIRALDRAADGRTLGGLAYSVRGKLAALRQSGAAGPRYEAEVNGLANQQRELLAMDVSVKTGGTTVANGVERFIVKYAR